MARYDDMAVPGGAEDDDSDEDFGVSHAGAPHKAKPRRKSHQRPQGSDQIRQAFSKRKKGLVLKAYQLSALTDAKVFMFIVNDKGTSWAYSTPGFSSALNPELMKELRALAQVPEHAKLITEVMPDPQNVRHPEAVPAAPDEPPGAHCTRTATGSLPVRSRSSYSGGSGIDAVPVARSGSTTTNARMHSAVLSEDQSPPKPRARPPSGSSMACGGARPGSAVVQSPHMQPFQQLAAQATLQQQQQQQRLGGKQGASMEPPNPYGVYALLGAQQLGSGVAAANESPTILSEVAASCGSPSSRQAEAGARLAAAVNAAAGMVAAAASAVDKVYRPEQQQQQQQQQRQQDHPPWLLQGGGGTWAEQQCLATHQAAAIAAAQGCRQLPPAAADGWVAVEVSNRQQPAAGGFDKDCELTRMCSSNAACPPALDGAVATPVAATCWSPLPDGSPATLEPLEQQQQQAAAYGSCAGSPPDAVPWSGQADAAAFECVQRSLAPLRLACAAAAGHGRDAEGTHSAPAGAVNSLLGPPSRWLDLDIKQEAASNSGLRVMSDAGCYRPCSSAYSSYGPSPRCHPAADGQGSGYASLLGSSAAASAARLASSEPASCGPSPMAALSQQLGSVLAVHSPLHPSAALAQQQPQQQQQQQQQLGGGFAPQHSGGWGGDASLVPTAHQQQQQQQQQQQAHNQGAYMPVTDDLVADPLMDMLMDQAAQARACAGPAQRQPPQRKQQMSIMEATLQQPPKQQQEHEQQEQQCPATASRQSDEAPEPPPTLLRIGGGLHHVSSMLDHIPCPPKSEGDKAAWQEQVRQLLSTLQPLQREELVAQLRNREQQARAVQSACGRAPADANAATAAAGPAGCIAFAPRPPIGMAAPAGGKQRLGPSRLSASSPAVDAGAAAEPLAAGAIPYVPASADRGPLAAAEAMLLQQQQQQQQQLAAAISRAEAAALPVPASCMPMLVQVPMSGGYNVQALVVPGSLAMPADRFALAACSAGLAGMGYGCAPQMLPMPLSSAAQQQPTLLPAQRQVLQAHSAPLGPAGAPWRLDVEARGAAGQAASAPPPRGELPGSEPQRVYSSPLKRAQPSVCEGMGSGFGEADEAMSPLKRTCRDLPEPPSFATLLQAEVGEDDAVAWASYAAANDSLPAAGSCPSLPRLCSLAASGSLPAFLADGGGSSSLQLTESQAVFIAGLGSGPGAAEPRPQAAAPGSALGGGAGTSAQAAESGMQVDVLPSASAP